MKELIHKYISEHKNEIINELKELIKIPSVKEAPEEGSPFGKSCAEALKHIKGLYEKNGFDTMLSKKGDYLLSSYGNSKKTLGLFAHADVVPVSDDWESTLPFEPIEKEGFIIGRGAIDDKSAVVISLYCLKMLKELKIPFKSSLICFTGSNEESGMADIKNYLSENTPPDFSLVADTAFPLYYGNKGSLLLNVSGKNPIECISDIQASNAKGAILGKIKITMAYSDGLYNYLKGFESKRLFVNSDGDKIHAEALGISKHTALAEGSLNAGFLIFNILKDCEYIENRDRTQIRFLSEILSDYLGKRLNIDNDDKTFGKLTFANDIIELKDGRLSLHFNIRFGDEVQIPCLKAKLENEFSKENFSITYENESPSRKTELENPLLQKCLHVYKEFTGDKNAPAYINAGGTYAKYIPLAVETGTTLILGAPRDTKEGHGGAHQPDECVNIEGFLKALELTLLMLIECDKTLNETKGN